MKIQTILAFILVSLISLTFGAYQGYKIGALNQQGLDAIPRSFMYAKSLEALNKKEETITADILSTSMYSDLTAFAGIRDNGQLKYSRHHPIHKSLNKSRSIYLEQIQSIIKENTSMFNSETTELVNEIQNQI